MKKKILIVALIGGSLAFECHAVVFNFKGGAANTIDIALFKNKGKFEDFIKMAGGSKDIANEIEKFTKENSEFFGDTVGGIAGTAASTAIGVAATPGVGAAASILIVPVFVKAGKIGFENYGRVAHFGAGLVKSASAKLYASHYFERVQTPKTICLGLVGERHRLIRSKEVIKADKLMNLSNVQPMYIAIFNRDTIKNKNDLEVIRDPETGAKTAFNARTYARPGDILYAGELSKEQLVSSIDITTHFIKEEAFDENGTPILDQDDKPLVLQRTVGVKFTTVDPEGGIECK